MAAQVQVSEDDDTAVQEHLSELLALLQGAEEMDTWDHDSLEVNVAGMTADELKSYLTQELVFM